jgi:sugar/nucleoside kinase (ribokinase family)
MTAATFDVLALGNAIVDVIAPAEDALLDRLELVKGSMGLVDAARSQAIYAAMAPGVEASGGSAGNTVAGVASFGGRAAYVGKVRDDALGQVFAHDLRAGGVAFDTAPATAGEGTGVSMINVTPDGQRTMATYLGAASTLAPEDVDAARVKDSAVVYLEGYLFDPPPARAAFAKAAAAAHEAGRAIALSLSDAFVVERHRDALLEFLPQVDLLFANEAEACAMFRSATFDEAAAELGRRVRIAAITRGEHGSVILHGGERAEEAATAPDRVIDTTGAGDQYAAGFLYGLSKDKPLQLCAKLGHLAACEVIGHYGPRPQTSLAALAREAGLI